MAQPTTLPPALTTKKGAPPRIPSHNLNPNLNLDFNPSLMT
jgi:hypothetical protein